MFVAITINEVLLFPNGVPPPFVLRGLDVPLLRPFPREGEAAGITDAEGLGAIAIVGKLGSEAPVADRITLFWLQLRDTLFRQTAVEIRVVYERGLRVLLD